MKYAIERCTLPGVGDQLPLTEAVIIRECYVIGASRKALLLRFPLTGREEWLARSQFCGRSSDDTVPDIDEFSGLGEHGEVRVPLYIVQKWLAKKPAGTDRFIEETKRGAPRE